MRINDHSATVEVHSGQWEYRQACMEADADLSQFGAESWELVTVVPVPYCFDPVMCRYYFRRRRV